MNGSEIALANPRQIAEQAAKLAARIREFLAFHPTPKSAMQAWFLTTKSVQTALSYYCRLVPSSALAVTAAMVAQDADGTLQAYIGLDFGAAKYESSSKDSQLPWERARLPGMFGGICAVNPTYGVGQNGKGNMKTNCNHHCL